MINLTREELKIIALCLDETREKYDEELSDSSLSTGVRQSYFNTINVINNLLPSIYKYLNS